MQSISLYRWAGFAFIFLCAAQVCLAGIRFESLTLDQAFEKAKRDKKNIFVDTYATWCGPCKVMEGVFTQQTVGDYFNSEFINIRVNMDGPQAHRVTTEFKVVFLPTMMIITPEGEILAKIDRLVDSGELISLAKDAQRGIVIAPSTTTSNSPITNNQVNQNTTTTPPEGKEEIIYVLDERSSSGRPHIMYHEAYLHLQLQDGKHQRVVDKYLSTQDDWSTEKNLKFIFDFLQDVNSKYFKYFIENKQLFSDLKGEQLVDRTINILVHQRLYQGYPRPTLKEATKLYNYINPNTALLNAYAYYFKRLEVEGQELEYITTAKKYLSHVNSSDDEVIYKMINYSLRRSDYKDHLSEYLTLSKTLTDIQPDNYQYHFLIAKLYYLEGDAGRATRHIDRALSLSTIESAERPQMQQLKSQISGL